MTKKILIFSIIFAFFGLISSNKVLAVAVCGNSNFLGACSANSCGQYDHEEPGYNRQCPSGQHCCVPNCVNDADCPPCFSCQDVGFLGWSGKSCVENNNDGNKCDTYPYYHCASGVCITEAPETCGSDNSGFCSYDDGGFFGTYCGPDSYIEESSNIQCDQNLGPDAGKCCMHNCSDDNDCPPCYSCEGILGGYKCTEQTTINGNKCNDTTCDTCLDGSCRTCTSEQFCAPGLPNMGTMNCLATCPTQGGICRSGCRSGESSPGIINCDSGKVCCISDSGDFPNTGNPCINDGGVCANECTNAILVSGTECDESGQVCCKTPCVTKYEGACEELIVMDLPNGTIYGKTEIPNTECENINLKCFTQKCQSGSCPDGWTCDLSNNCIFGASECEMNSGQVLVPTDTPDGCPTGFIKNDTLSGSLNEVDLASEKICCVKMDSEKVIKKTSTFFQGIGSDCMDKGNCSVNDMINVAINITRFLTGLIGSVALLFFIISGVMMVFSGGSEEKVTKAKTMMVQTVIGLFIFLGAYMIVSFVQDSLNIGQQYKIKSEPPQMVEVKTETNKCQTQKPGWSCQKRCQGQTSASDAWWACIDKEVTDGNCVKNLCEGDDDNMCCK